MIRVVRELRVTGDVLHQEDAAGPKRGVDALEHARGARLIVNRVERGDQVIGVLEPQLRGIGLDERDVAQVARRDFGAARGNRLGRQVDASEAALRKRLGHRQDRAAASARDVEHVNPRAETADEPVRQGQDVVQQAVDDGLPALFRHDGVKSRIGAIGHAAAVTERLDHRIFGAAEDADPLRRHGDVVRARRPRQAAACSGGKRYMSDPASYSTMPPVTIAPSHSRT